MKTQMLKKVIAWTLALTMVMTMNVSAFAVTDTAEQAEPAVTEESVAEKETEPEVAAENAEPALITETEQTEAATVDSAAEVEVEEAEPAMASDEDQVVGSGTCGENVTWTWTRSGILTFTGSGPMKDYELIYNETTESWRVPTPFDSFDVEGLEYELHEVIIEEGITSIGEYVFSGCENIKSIEIPDSVTSIGNNAFYDCGIESIEIPGSVISIGENAFYDCGSLSYIKLSEGLQTIGDSAFYGCSNLKEITIPNSVTSIENYAFYECDSLENVNLSEGLLTLGFATFSECRINSIVIPESVITLDIASFGGGLSEITFLGQNTEVKGFTERSITVNCKLLSKAYDYALENEWPVNIIGEHEDAGMLTDSISWSYKYPDKELVITGEGQMPDFDFGGYTPWYKYQEWISKVIIDDGITGIGNCAFYRCTAMKEIDLPDNLIRIGEDAFYFCSALSEIDIPDSVAEIGSSAFNSCSALTSVKIPEGVTVINNSMFYGCTSLTQVDLPDSVTSMGYYVFRECKSLKTIKIPSGITVIDEFAFYDCDSLEEVDIPDSVTEIARYAFYDCAVLAKVKLPDNLKSIGDSAFCRCMALTNIDIPETVINIGNDAFAVCESLVTVVIPKNVQSLEETFWYCTDLKEITVLGDSTELNDVLELPSETLIRCNLFSKAYNYATANGLSVELLGESVASGTVNDTVEWEFNHDTKTLNLSGKGEIPVPTENTPVPWANFTYGIKRIVLGEELTMADNSAFSDCKNLESVEGNNSNIISSGSAGKTAEWRYDKISNTLIISGTGTVARDSFVTEVWNEEKVNVRKLVIGEGITAIESSAFAEFTGITQCILPETVSSIGSAAFQGCTGLETVAITNKNATIEKSAFKDCTALTTVVLPNIDKYGYNVHPAFEGCSVLSTVIMPYDVQYFNSYILKDENRKVYVTVYYYNPESEWTLKTENVDVTMEDSCCDEHMYVDQNRKATLESDGSIIEICCVCGHEGNTEVISKIGEVVIDQEKCTYNGEVHNPGVIVYDSKGSVVPDYCYDVTYYKGCILPGTYGATVTFYGQYEGKITKTFDIVWDGKETAGIELEYTSAEYTGSYIKPGVTVKGLTENDYTVSYSNNVYPGTATATVKAKNQQTGVDLTFEIGKIDINNVTFYWDERYQDVGGCPYMGTPYEPFKNYASTSMGQLTEGADYTIEYKDNVEGGTATCIITGKGGRFTGSRTFTFDITDPNLEMMSGLDWEEMPYNGENQIPEFFTEVLLQDPYSEGEGKWLDVNYTVEYPKNSKYVGEYTIYVHFDDKILGKWTEEHTYRITSNNSDYHKHQVNSGKVTKATFGKQGTVVGYCEICGEAGRTMYIPAVATPKLSATAYTFNNKAKKPTVKIAGLSSKDYTVKYAAGRKNVGTYKVTVTLKGANYSGSKTLQFQINPAKPTGVKLTKGKKQFKVSWKKASATNRKQIDGYEIRYATSKSKLSKAKPKKYSGKTLTNKTIKKLKSKKTYYVQVRTYNKIGKKTYVSGWTTAKKVKTK